MAELKFLSPLKLLLLAVLFYSKLYSKPAETYNNIQSIEGFNFIRTSTNFQVGLDVFITSHRRSTRVTTSNLSHQANLIYSLLLLSGDISTNPGPTWKFPCGLCAKPFKNNQKGICCDRCNFWIHLRCCTLSISTYEDMANSSCVWICPTCESLNFSNSILHSDVDLDLSNHFSPLEEDITTEVTDISVPLLQSSPIIYQRSSSERLKLASKKEKNIPLKFMVLNCRSLKSTSKQAEFHVLTDEVKPDIICGTESHLNDSISSNEIFPNGYEIFRKDRDLHGGGVFIAVSNKYIASSLPELDTNCELIWINLQCKGARPLYICTFYRPPKSDFEVLEALGKSLGDLNQHKSLPNIVLAGDFNLPDILWESSSINTNRIYSSGLSYHMMDIANDNYLTQLVTEPTRDDNILDLIFTTTPDLIDSVQVRPGMSDHYAVTAEINMRAKYNLQKPRSVYLYKRANWDKIKDDLHEFQHTFLASTPYDNPVNDNWQNLKSAIMDSVKINIPTKSLKTQHNLPWFNQDLKRAVRKKKRLYKKAKRTNDTKHWKDFKVFRKLVKIKLAEAHDNYVKDLLDTSLHEKPKRFWSYIKSRKLDHMGIPTLKKDGNLITTNEDKANLLSENFQRVFTTEDLSNIPNMGDSNIPNISPINFNLNGILKLLKGLNVKKACGPDQIPIRVMKYAAQEIAPVMEVIFNQSLNSGILPDDWLTANVTPIFKKGKKSDPCNYRPVSLTSVSCKIMEHILYSQIMGHLDENSILVKFQHGFRTQHSCESQLIITLNDLTKNMDNNTQTDLFILDFAKAFDTVPHERLLEKLHYYGIRGKIHLWIRTWLKQRTQTTVVGGVGSGSAPVSSGVPQGTVLGPLMFLLYINDIGENIKSNIKLFADDCLLYRSINSEDDTESLQEDLNHLIRWSDKWQMSFNSTKCYELKVTRKTNPIAYNYNINGVALKPVEEHPYLGVHLAKDLKWNVHVAKTAKKANSTLGFIRRNLGKCSQDVKERAYNALVRPHMEYATAAWDPYTKKNIEELEKIQRRAARFVTSTYSYYHSVSSLLKDLKWNSLSLRRTISRLSIMYKIINKQIAIDIPPEMTKPTRTLRRSHKHSFIQLQTRTDSYKYSFFPRTIIDWNSLPESVISQSNTEKFKEAALQYYVSQQGL